MNALVDQSVHESRKQRNGSAWKDPDTGRFIAGNPGKPKGAQEHTARDIRSMVKRALSEAGGVRYLVQQAQENPRAFLGLVGRCLPLDVTSSDGSMRPVVALYMPDNRRDAKLVADTRPAIDVNPTPALAVPAPPRQSHE